MTYKTTVFLLYSGNSQPEFDLFIYKQQRMSYGNSVKDEVIF